ncbi:DUF4158 domain-containing protein [Streptomyces sp. wa53]|uniref:DUF4158 domain-containing protein n=1 Tax=Streptomyces sp. wa53 TaxID=1828268 RepID=UPI003C7EA289
MTSIERTAYPRFKRLITAHELHLFFSPTRDEIRWAADATDGDEHLLALLLMLKSYQRMGCFPALEDVPEQVVEFVRRQVELPEGMLPLYRAERTAKHHRGLVRKKAGVKYDQGEARRIVERSIRREAAAKNRPADLINIALEKIVEAGLELPGFSTFDKMASKIRTEVNASIRESIHDRMSPVQAELLRLLEERDSDGTTLFNRLKKPAKGPTWSHWALWGVSGRASGRSGELSGPWPGHPGQGLLTGWCPASGSRWSPGPARPCGSPRQPSSLLT